MIKILTCNINLKFLANIFKFISSCTAVCPRSSSTNVKKIPSLTLVQHFTITTIL